MEKLMRKPVSLLGAAALILPAMALAMPHKKVATISEATARTRALARVPHGMVKSTELEHEHGRLVYSFDIGKAGQPGVEEVQIDAHSGKLVSQKHETAAKERQEAVSEAKEGIKK
jgi:hypothetical protein